MIETNLAMNSKFRGNENDLVQFRKLVESRIRTDEREQALHAWQAYKYFRQSNAIVREKEQKTTKFEFQKHGLWTKGDYIKSLTNRTIDLTGATLTDVCVGYSDLRGVNFDEVTFKCEEIPWMAMKGASLENTSFRKVQIDGARFNEADLRNSDFSGASLVGADFEKANLSGADLSNTNLTGANLTGASLVGATVEGCVLDGANVYGVSAWDLRGKAKSSKDLNISPANIAIVTVDDIQVAQFLYLLMNNPKIRNVLDTVTRKVVLILGRFSPARKEVLDALRDELRDYDLVPVLFDFDVPKDRDITETVTLLARMSRFIVADLTDPASIPQELQAIVPNVAVPVCLIIEEGHKPYSLAEDLKKYYWLIRPFNYKSIDILLKNLKYEIIDKAEKVRSKIEQERNDEW